METISLTEGKWDGDIVTNPPYKYAEQFIRKSLSILDNDRYVAMFLPTRYLEGIQRHKMFEELPPYKIFISTNKRIKAAKNGDFEAMKGSAVSYMWIVFKKGYQGETVLKWFNY